MMPMCLSGRSQCGGRLGIDPAELVDDDLVDLTCPYRAYPAFGDVVGDALGLSFGGRTVAAAGLGDGDHHFAGAEAHLGARFQLFLDPVRAAPDLPGPARSAPAANAVPDPREFLTETLKNAQATTVPDGVPVVFGAACNETAQKLVDKVWTRVLQ